MISADVAVTKFGILLKEAVVAEWLRRLTRNQFPSGSVGSNPTDCDKNFSHGFSLCVNMGHLSFLTCPMGIVGSVVECSPATRAARVRFPDDANFFPKSSQSAGFEPALPEGN